MSIHPTAIIDPEARLAEGVEVGPYALIGAGVTLGARCRVGPHACLRGPLTVGEECEIGFSAAIGHDPQVKGHKGPFGATRIGARNVFREFSQVHRSMAPEGTTVLGDDNYLMACAHVAHDCALGNHVVLCNGALLAGHVHVGDRAFLSGGAAVHQFCRIGQLAMIGGGAGVNADVVPFAMVVGSRPARVKGVNVVGLKRAGIQPQSRVALRAAFRALFRSRAPVPERIASIDASTPEVAHLVAFLSGGRRGVLGLSHSSGDEDE